MRQIRSPWRWPAAAMLLANAVFHLILTPAHLDEAPYVGVLFLALSVVSIVLAAVLVIRDTAAAWAISGVVAFVAIIAFLVSRTIGLPQIGDDIGNWSEPLGFPALIVEALTVAFAALALVKHSAPRPGRRHERTAP